MAFPLNKQDREVSLTSYLFTESTVPADVITEIATRQVIHHQVQVLSVLKRVVHIYNEEILKLCKNLALVDDGFDTSLGDDASL